eukprot:SM000033S12328  [mRNA]  locus=s33:253064:254621:+ [translate_table: standard]
MEVQAQPAEAAKAADSLRQSSLSSYFPAKRGGPGASNPPCKRSKPLPPPITSPMHGLATAAVHSKRLICFSPEACGGGGTTAPRAEPAATPRQGGSTLTTDTAAAAGAAAAATPAESAASGSPRYRTSFAVEVDLASQSAAGTAATPTRARRSLCSDFLSVAASPPPPSHFGTPQSRLAAVAPGLPRSREEESMRPPLRQGARVPPLALPLLTRSEPTAEALQREEAAAAVAVQVAALVGLHAGGLRSSGGRLSSQTEPDARLHAGLKQERLRILKSIGSIVQTLHKDATPQLAGSTAAAPVEHATAAAEEPNVAGEKSLNGSLDLVKMPSCFGQGRSPERHGAPNNLHIHLRAALRTFVEGVVAKLVEEQQAHGKRGNRSGVTVTRQDVLQVLLPLSI